MGVEMVERLVSIINWSVSGSMLIYQRVYVFHMFCSLQVEQATVEAKFWDPLGHPGPLTPPQPFAAVLDSNGLCHPERRQPGPKGGESYGNPMENGRNPMEILWNRLMMSSNFGRNKCHQIRILQNICQKRYQKICQAIRQDTMSEHMSTNMYG